MSLGIAPDHDMEQFWIDFKSQISYFYSNHSLPTKSWPPLKDWSNHLNLLQSESRFAEIQSSINNYLYIFGLDVLSHGNSFDFNLFLTRFRRWLKLQNNLEFSIIDSNYSSIFKLKNIIEIAEICLLRPSLHSFNYLSHLSPIILFIENPSSNPIESILPHLKELIDISVQTNIPSILNHLANLIPLTTIVKTIYHITLPPNIQPKKIHYLLSQTF